MVQEVLTRRDFLARSCERGDWPDASTAGGVVLVDFVCGVAADMHRFFPALGTECFSSRKTTPHPGQIHMRGHLLKEDRLDRAANQWL